MKKWLSILLALAILFAGAPAMAKAAKPEALPTAWDLTDLYASDDAWYAALADTEMRAPGLAEYRGKLSDPRELLAFVELGYALSADAEQLYEYAVLRTELDASDSAANTMLSKAALLIGRLMEESAFADEELFAIDLPARKLLLTGGPLAPYEYALSWYLDEDSEPMSEEAASLLAYLLPSLNQAQAIYQIFTILELPDPILTLDSGKQVVLDDYGFWDFLAGNRSREVKIAANRAYNGRYDAYINTLTALFDAHVRAGWTEAMLYGYDSTRAYMTDVSLLDPAIYDLLIEYAHDNIGLFQRFYALHAKAMGLNEQYPFDAAIYASDHWADYYDYEDAVALVREALAPLGDDYLASYDRIVRSGHIDVYEAQTKNAGAFTYASPNGIQPYLLLNYYGSIEDLSTLAHEMGHAVYFDFTSNHQLPCYLQTDAFTQEVASTLNQLLLTRHFYENADSDEERLFYAEDAIYLFISSFFQQVMLAEFEDSMYKTVEAGEALSADALSQTYAALYDQYYGGTVVRLEGEENAWAGIPHLIIYRYYVYQYATSVVYALALYERIAAGDVEARDAYLTMLARGASADPVDLLLDAGIDPTSPQTYQVAMDVVDGWLDEYEQLIEARPEFEDPLSLATNLFAALRATATRAPVASDASVQIPDFFAVLQPSFTPAPSEAPARIPDFFAVLQPTPSPAPSGS